MITGFVDEKKSLSNQLQWNETGSNNRGNFIFFVTLLLSILRIETLESSERDW